MNTPRLIVPLACLLLAACSFLEPRADPTRYFVLAPETAAAPAASAQLSVVVGPLQLPDYLLRPEIVRRAGPNQLEPSRMDRWAEPIDRAFMRVLCLDLAARLPQSTVVPFPASGSQGAVGFDIEVIAFEADLAGTVRLEGNWRMRGGSDGQRAGHAFRLERAAGSRETADEVAALSGLVGQLAGEIAAELGGATPSPAR